MPCSSPASISLYLDSDVLRNPFLAILPSLANIKKSLMDSDEVKFEVIKESLKRIISNTLWIGTIDLIILLGLSQKQQNISIGQFLFPIQYIAIITVLVLLYFTISIVHKFDRIITLYKKIENPEKRQCIKDYLNLYPSILNPFAQHEDSEKSIVLDNLGLGIQSIFYLTGFSLSLRYLLPNSKLVIVLFIILAILLLSFRQDLIQIEKEFETIVTKRNKSFKNILTYILLGLYLLVSIFVSIK